ncbi:auxin-induced protein 15A-like [Gossypium raimondii]|uniref:auxin-induced protein 15A-like n=1 Tax=Gossypium raimondii TaxID=29730 RepID=UPI00227AF825|nr:auxin-induced protein 15A-like [Gossypium raimondii]
MFIGNTYLHILKVLQFSEIFLFFRFRSIHLSKITMAIRMPRIISSKKVPKGYFAVYVGENQKRFVIPVSFLNQPLFQDLLGMSEQEFGYSHPTGGITIPCNEDIFLVVTSRLN